MMNKIAGISALIAALLLAGCATSPTPVVTSSSDYKRAYRSGDYAGAAALASRAPAGDTHARLVEGMARAELGQHDRAVSLLNPLIRSSDPEVRGRAAATLGLIAQERGDHAEASRLLGIASDSLAGSDGVWAARYALRARDSATSEPSQRTHSVGSASQPGAYQIQFGSFSTQARAQRHAQAVSRLTRSSGLDTPRIETVQRGARTLYAVRTGPFASRSAATSAASRLDTETAVVLVQ